MGERGIAAQGLGLAGRLSWPVSPGALRFVLAMIVFVHHYSSFGLGQYAVYVFFVLSGFWVRRMWAERYMFTRMPYLTFMVSRLWRLAPVMLLVSAITIPLLPPIGIPWSRVFTDGPAYVLGSTLLLFGYGLLDYRPVGSAWSLDIEMQFYALVPLLALFVARFRWWFALAVGGGISVLSMVLTDALISLTYVVFFLVGMVTAEHRWKPSPMLVGGSAAAVMLTLMLVTLSPWNGILWGGADPGPLFAWNPWINTLLAFATIPLALHTVWRSSDSTDAMLGDLSYIVYLLHWIGMQWFFTFEGSFMERLPYAAVCFAGVPLASLVIWRFYDRPLNRARARWVARRMREPVPTLVTCEPAGP